MKFLFATALALLLAAPSLPAAPKEPPPPPPPPMAQTQTLSIFRGRTVEITLHALGRTPGQLKFFIRSQPKHGKLSDLRVTGRKTAVVTYTHDSAAGSAADSFTFAVQAQDTPVSAPGEIRLVISEEPAAMSVVHAVDFGRVWLGETREEEITLQNTGGGVLAGRVSVPDPWKILGSPEYRLARRQQARVRVAFAPTEARAYSGELLFSHDARSSVRLSGEAAAPFSFDPARQVELSNTNDSLLRTGTLAIRNESDRARTVEIIAPGQIITQDDVTIPAGGTEKLKLQTKSDFLGMLEGELELESEGFRQTLALRVYAVKPVLAVQPKALDFGSVPAAQRTTRTLEIKNEGGADAHLQAQVPSEILLIPDPAGTIITPGETRKFDVAFEPQSAADYAREIKITLENGSSTVIPVTATVNGNRNRTSAPLAGGIPGATPRLPPPPTPPPDLMEDTAPAESYNGIPKVENITSLPATKPGLIELTWPKPAIPVASWLVEGRLWRDGKIAWDPWPGVKFREQDGKVVGRFENMPPGRYVIRIRALDAGGKKSAPSLLVSITVPPRPPWHLFRWFLAVLVVAGAVYLVRRSREQQRARAAEDDRRIARLGND